MTNQATFYGGAIRNTDNLIINNCEFSQNYAGTEETQADDIKILE
ncbi:MAG: hypothetical protein Q8N97_00445 [Methanobacteriaceae archaeon]|nr:hypothetical protein [Methanobacteriaceae archaeon]MDP3486247.1 hypothetical protein [Methanobacteriaceae archaeon]